MRKRKSLDLTVGLDFGTSATKVCVREALGLDLDIDVYPVRLEGQYLCPSLVALKSGSFFFGHQAKSLVDSGAAVGFSHLKVCIACQSERGHPLADCSADRDPSNQCGGQFPIVDATAEELAICFLAWVMGSVPGHLPDALDVKKPELTFNLGVPAAQLDPENSLARVYQRIGQSALAISNVIGQGVSSAVAIGAARQALRGPLLESKDSLVQLCPESEAAMISYLVSPATKEGPYGIVDIGAWTSDFAIFRLMELTAPEHAGDRCNEYYAAASERIALNTVDSIALASISGDQTQNNPAPNVPSLGAIREFRESGLPTSMGTELWRTAIDSARRAVSLDLYERLRVVLRSAGDKAGSLHHFMKVQRVEPGNTPTYKPTKDEPLLKIYIVGGGAMEPELWKSFSSPSVVCSVDVVPALELSQGLSGPLESRFAVALGLAYPRMLWPWSFSSSSTPPFPRPRSRTRPEYDELGFGK